MAGDTHTLTDLGTRLLDALAARNYDAIGACFAEDATMRSIVPPGLREDDGRAAIEARYRIWTAATQDYEMLEAEATRFADLLRLRWVVRGIEDGENEPTTFEQTAYAEVADGVITKMRLACSGDRPIA